MSFDEDSDDLVQVNLPELRHRVRMVAHDVRSLLGPLAGYTELIQNSDDMESIGRYSEAVLSSAESLEALADSMIERIIGDTDRYD